MKSKSKKNMNVYQHEGTHINEPITTVHGITVLKRYLKIKTIGNGSSSRCFLVKNVDSESHYAVKVIPKISRQDLSNQKMIYQIKIHKLMTDPHIVHLDHWFEDERFTYIFMEYCPNGNLENRVKQLGRLSESQIKKHLKQLAEGLKYIHSKNVIHRDLKLSNCYLDVNNCIKLGDFGFACQLNHQNEKKRETCGTPNYIAPEVFSGFGYSFQSDMWSVGIMLYRMRCGLCPFQMDTVIETLQKIKTCTYTFPQNVRFSKKLQDIIQKLLVLNYDERLTAQQILSHKFLAEDGSQRRPSSIMSRNARNQDKKSFSLVKLIKETVLPPKKKEEPVMRSNSCDTSKEIKQIFKQKSKATLCNHQTPFMSTELETPLKTQCSISRRGSINIPMHTSMSVIPTTGNAIKNAIGTSQSMLPAQIICSLSKAQKTTENKNSKPKGTISSATKDLKTIANQSIQNVANNFKQTADRSSRLDQFIKANSKSIIMIKQEATRNTRQNNILKECRNFSAIFASLRQKHYLPMWVQLQQNIVVVQFKHSLAQIYYKDNVIVLNNGKDIFYNMQGGVFEQLPKLVKYVIQSKVSINGESEKTLDSNYMHKLPGRLLSGKLGILLEYPNSKGGLFVAKLLKQELFFMGLEESRLRFLFSWEKMNGHRLAEGVDITTAYEQWISLIKSSNGK